MIILNTFDLVKDLTFERVAGSDAEQKAISIITNYIKELDGSYEIEEFMIPDANISNCSLTYNNVKCEVKGFKRSGNINQTLELVIVEDIEMLDYLNITDKACLVLTTLNYKLYEEISKRGAKAIIAISGSLYDDVNETDLLEKSLRDRHLNFGQIPSFMIRAIDAEKIIASSVKEITLVLEQEEIKKTSCNIISEIKGSINNEIVVFTAHYDSVRFSKGAYDNATGSATILELYKYYLENRPKRTIRFIWCGAEEMGLLGSKDYSSRHREDMLRLVINVDMTAVNIGKDICCVSGEDLIANYLEVLSKEVGFALNAYTGVYSSDSTPFADIGVPSLSFARLANSFGAQIHSRRDNGLFLSENYFYKTVNFIKTFSDHVLNSVIFPFKKVIPETIKEKINKYYGR